MTDATNVVAFAPRAHRDPPALTHVELRLRDENCNLQMSVCDSEGNIFVLEYAVKPPPDFDLNRLRRAWAEWRHSSAPAS